MLDTKNVMRITCLVLLGALGGCTPTASGDAVSTVRWETGGNWMAGAVTDTVVGAPIGATVRVAASTATLAAGTWCEAAPSACADLARPALALSPTALSESLWLMAKEHTSGKRKSTWDKHTKTRSGGKEKKDDRMRFSQGEDDGKGKAKREKAQDDKEKAKKAKEDARQQKEEERIQREAEKREKASAKKK
ncbi:hypothetical protein ACLEPN_13205 [Myxococcus sp. 1LA]